MRRLAEDALAICLFTDAASANLVVLRCVQMLSARLLLLGLPLTIVCGVSLAWLMFGGLGWFELAFLATILVPTDAALGQAVVTNRVVPDRVRESLNLESSLNDGIYVPLALFFMTLSLGAGDTSQPAWRRGGHIITGLVLARGAQTNRPGGS